MGIYGFYCIFCSKNYLILTLNLFVNFGQLIKVKNYPLLAAQPCSKMLNYRKI